MTQKTKLLFLVTEDWYFLSHRFNLALAAKNAGFDVILVTQVSDHADYIQSVGIKLIPVRFSRSFRNPLSDLQTIYSLIKIYLREKPEILHHVALKPVVFGSIANILVSLFKKNNHPPQVVNALTGLGYIYTSTNRSTGIMRSAITGILKLIFSKPDYHLILQNSDDYQMFIKQKIVSAEKLSLIRGSGVDTNVYKPDYVEHADIVIIFVARMLKDKGLDEFVSAAALLKNKKVSARFILVGDTDSENPSSINTETLQSWNSKGVIEWWGKCNDMPAIYHQADIVVLPSYREGLPKVLLEAAACGLPIVTTDVPGCREIVKNSINGLLVPIKDSNALANAIETLIDNAELRKEMGERGREMVEMEFSIDKVIDETLNLYNQLLNRS